MPETYPSDPTFKNAVDSVADVARTAAENVDEARQAVSARLSKATDYVRSFDGRRALGDVERMVKDNPGPSMLIAAALGFVIGRAFTRD